MELETLHPVLHHLLPLRCLGHLLCLLKPSVAFSIEGHLLASLDPAVDVGIFGEVEVDELEEGESGQDGDVGDGQFLTSQVLASCQVRMLVQLTQLRPQLLLTSCIRCFQEELDR